MGPRRERASGVAVNDSGAPNTGAKGPAAETPGASLPLDASVLSIVANLDRLDLNGLRRQWRARLGGEAPAHLPRWPLMKVLVYRLQSDAFGDLDKSIHLSIRSIAAFTLMASSYAMIVWQFGATATIVFALAIGATIGTLNGLLIVDLRIPDLLATLGTMFLLAGLELIPSAGRSITTGLILSDGSAAQGAFDPAFLAVGRRQLFGAAPLPVVIVAIFAVIFWFLMERTRWGRVFTRSAVTR
jgi:hypothetical protein